MVEKCGDWVKKIPLGYGSFGAVSLWENKIDKKRIAIKTCRPDLDLSPKNQKRWIQEIDILMKIRHPNVIQALDWPADNLKKFFSHNKLPALCMEYCEGGDLRKTLSTVENCCGLRQTMIIKVCRDICKAIQCLHSYDIAHRDLKPENIVISRIDNKIIFKVIDLGYAKQLDQSSSQHSHVGTTHYLAPEILMRCKSYTKNVDYWSYGCLIFECCTGIRPFDPILYSKDDLKSIAGKESKFISANSVKDDKGDITLELLESLPEVNQLDRALQPKFEELFCLLLDGCPQQRGGNNRWIECVDEIISYKVITVFCIDCCTEYTYNFSPKLSVNELQKEIYKDTKIPEIRQELYLIDGNNVGLSLETVNTLVFVFNKDFRLRDRVNCRNQLPRTVNELLRDPRGFVNNPMKRHIEVYKHSVYFIQRQYNNHCSLTRGLKALVISLLKLRQRLNETNKFQENLSSLKATIDFFKLSLSIDMKKYCCFWQNHGLPHQKWQRTIQSWKKMESELNQNNIFEEGGKICELKKLLHNQIAVIRNEDQISQAPKRCGEQIAQRVEDIRAKYEELKKTGQSSSCWKGKVQELAEFLESFLDEIDEINEEFYTFFIDVVSLRKKLAEFFEQLSFLNNCVKKLENDVKLMQQTRQEDLWKLLPTQQGTDKEQKIVQEEKYLSKRPTSRIIKENQELVSRVKETIQTVKEQEEMFQRQSQNFDWSFLRDHH